MSEVSTVAPHQIRRPGGASRYPPISKRHALGLQPLGDRLCKTRAIRDARVGELETDRRIRPRRRIRREVVDPVPFRAEIEHRLRIPVCTRHQLRQPANRLRPVKRQQVILNRQHRRRVDRLAHENAFDQLAALGQAKDLGQGPGGRVAFQPLNGARAQDQHAMRGLTAHDFLPGEGGHIQLVPRQVLRKRSARRVADRQPRAVRRDGIAVGHAHAAGRTIPCEHHVGVEIDLRKIDDLAVLGRLHLSLQLQLLDHIRDPARAKAFPGDHRAGSCAQHRPHGHFHGARVGGRDNTDAVVRRHAKDIPRRLDCRFQLGLANGSSVRAAKRRASELVERMNGGFGTRARGKTRIGRPRRRFVKCHLLNTLTDMRPSLGRGVPPPGIRGVFGTDKPQKAPKASHSVSVTGHEFTIGNRPTGLKPCDNSTLLWKSRIQYVVFM
jgi:hypothetical protein